MESLEDILIRKFNNICSNYGASSAILFYFQHAKDNNFPKLLRAVKNTISSEVVLLRNQIAREKRELEDAEDPAFTREFIKDLERDVSIMISLYPEAEIEVENESYFDAVTSKFDD